MRNIICLLVVFSVMFLLAGTSQAALSVPPGYQVTTLYTASTGSSIAGLDLYDGQLYFGEYTYSGNTAIQSFDISSLSTTTLCTIPTANGNSLVTVNPSSENVYVANSTNASVYYSYEMGYVDSTGTFNLQATVDGAYDSAVDSMGSLYITADPGGAAASQVFSYDWSTGSTTSIIDIGGYCAGLAFDAEDNLYVAYYDSANYNNSEIFVFDATTLANATSILTTNNASSSFSLAAPGYLTVDSENGYLYASYLWGSCVDRINLTDTTDRLTVVSGGGSKIVLGDAGELYVVDSPYGGTGTVSLVSVPEPSTLILILVGLASLMMLRRK